MHAADRRFSGLKRAAVLDGISQTFVEACSAVGNAAHTDHPRFAGRIRAQKP
jgi:hypothetical protein